MSFKSKFLVGVCVFAALASVTSFLLRLTQGINIPAIESFACAVIGLCIFLNPEMNRNKKFVKKLMLIVGALGIISGVIQIIVASSNLN